MIDAHSAESNEKIIFRFLFCESGLIIFTIYGRHTGIFKCVINQKKIVQKWSNLQKRCAMSWSEWKIQLTIFIFELWLILSSKFIEKSTKFEYKNDHISKTKNGFLFVPAHCTSFNAYMNIFEILSMNLSIWLKKISGGLRPLPRLRPAPRIFLDWGT